MPIWALGPSFASYISLISDNARLLGSQSICVNNHTVNETFVDIFVFKKEEDREKEDSPTGFSHVKYFIRKVGECRTAASSVLLRRHYAKLYSALQKKKNTKIENTTSNTQQAPPLYKLKTFVIIFVCESEQMFHESFSVSMVHVW